MDGERTVLFACALRVAFVLVATMRAQLKLQFEVYMRKLMHIVTSDHVCEYTRTHTHTHTHTHTMFQSLVEHKEMALEAVDALWRIPNLITELYVNYDCDVYCSNLFDDVVKLLSNNAFPV